MSLTLASSGSPSYFVPASGAAATVDYRGGLVRELVHKVHGVVKDLSDRYRAVASLLESVDLLNGSARVEEFHTQLIAIERFCAVPTNWSVNPVEAPSAEQIDAANRGLIMLLLAGVVAPKVMLMNDGTLAAAWRRGDAYASIDFDADGEFPWSAAAGTDITSGTWTGGELPTKLRDAIGA